MKTAILLVIAALALTAMAKPKWVDPSNPPKPQWTCPKLTTENAKAAEAKANSNKCQYLEFIRQEFIDQYRTPQYPSCYAQINESCTDKIADFYEKKNIRTFSVALIALCEDGDGQWDEFVTLLEEFQSEYPDSYNTDYWTCIHDTAQGYADDQYVTFPAYPAPYLDVLNWVCQGLESQLKNAERQAYQDFFDANDGFSTLSSVGQPLWEDMQDLFSGADLNADLQQCLISEANYFWAATVPEVDGAYNTKENRGDDYEQAFLYIDEEESLPIPWDEDEEGYECWNYYAPRKHYHQKQDKVSENAFDGNRGHPLCPPNTMYQPLSMYGPICCPIHPIDFKPRTYNCCYQSIDLYQLRRRRTMRKRAECYGCTCLEGYYMELQGDYWTQDTDGGQGACLPEYPKEG